MIQRVDRVERRGPLYSIHWTDDRGRSGTTVGSASSANVHALLTRAKREGVYASKAIAARDPKALGPYLYVAQAFDHRGHARGRWRHATVKGAMALADHHAHPSNSVKVNAAYTSDGTFHGEGRGREMAYRRPNSGGRWSVEAYQDARTETPNRFVTERMPLRDPKGRKRPSTRVQTVILPKARFSRAQAIAWAKIQGFHVRKIDETGSSYRIRQHDPRAFHSKSFRTIPLGKHGAQAVIGRPLHAGSSRDAGRDPSHPGLDKAALMKGIDREQRQAARAKLRGMREEIRAAVGARRGGKAGLKEFCAIERAQARARIDAIRQKLRAELREVGQRERLEARGSCDRARRSPGIEIARLRQALAEERAYQSSLRRILAANKRRSPGIAKASARVRQGESDDEVRQNIPPDLVPLFDRVKRQIKGSGRISRTEAFLQYAEENPSEHYHGIEGTTDALIADLERQQRAGRRDVRRRRRGRFKVRQAARRRSR